MITYHRTCRAQRKRGFTLLEVLLSCMILAGSIATLAQLNAAAARAAVVARLRADATLRCESVVNELLVGARELTGGVRSFADDPQWQWDARVNASYSDQLGQLKVSVWRDGTMAEASRVEILRLVELSAGGSSLDFLVGTRSR